MNERNLQEHQIDIVSGSHRELDILFPHVHKSKRPLILQGHPGIGKTAFMRAQAQKIAEQLGLGFSDNPDDINNETKYLFLEIIAHQLDQGDVKGLYFPNADRTKTVCLPLDTFPEKGNGMIFLDEINLALPGVMNNLYQITTKGRIGKYKVPDSFSIYCAGNLDTDRAYTHEMPRPLNNRLLHYLFTVPKLIDWMHDFAEVIGLDYRIMLYLASRPDLLYFMPEDADDDIKAFPTPRTWEYSSDLIKDIPDASSGLLGTLVGMAVGRARGAEFEAFVEMNTKHNIPEIFKTKSITIPDEFDQMYALSSGLIGYYKENLTGKKGIEFACTLGELAKQFPAEDTAFILSSAKSVDKNYFDTLRKNSPETHSALMKRCKGVVN